MFNEGIRSKDIKIIYLNLNQIEVIDNLEVFKDNLEELFLQGNRIRSIDNIHSQCLSKLKKLDISNNQLKSLRNINILQSLSVLNIENNNISSIKGILL